MKIPYKDNEKQDIVLTIEIEQSESGNIYIGEENSSGAKYSKSIFSIESAINKYIETYHKELMKTFKDKFDDEGNDSLITDEHKQGKKYVNGLAKDDFLQYMYEKFPEAYMSLHARELLESIVDYCTNENFTHSENDLFYTLQKIIPAIEEDELLAFMNHDNLTNEVLHKPKINVDSLEKLQSIIENQGWKVEDVSYYDSIGWSISKYSPAGEDFYFEITHNNDVNTAYQQIINYTLYGFDKDEHIAMWIEAKNNKVNGVPSTRKLVIDADDIQSMLNELRNELENCDLEKQKDKELHEPDICD